MVAVSGNLMPAPCNVASMPNIMQPPSTVQPHTQQQRAVTRSVTMHSGVGPRKRKWTESVAGPTWHCHCQARCDICIAWHGVCWLDFVHCNSTITSMLLLQHHGGRYGTHSGALTQGHTDGADVAAAHYWCGSANPLPTTKLMHDISADVYLSHGVQRLLTQRLLAGHHQDTAQGGLPHGRPLPAPECSGQDLEALVALVVRKGGAGCCRS
jgi:hypothetical protein